MTISSPDMLTIDSSEKYVVSIRFEPDGLSFSGYNPSEKESFFYQKVNFDRSKDYLSSLKEYFFAHGFLTYTYKRVYVLPITSQYTIVPETVFEENEKDQFLTFCFSNPEKKVLSNSLKDESAEIVFGMNEDLYDFCFRSLVNPVFIHYLCPLLSLWKKQSKLHFSKQMFVTIHQKMMDIICYEQGKLLFINSFDYTHSNDVLYYILYVWKQVGMNQQIDQLSITGNKKMLGEITNTLRIYLQHVKPMEIPLDAYMLGGNVMIAPMDLISLFLCES